MNDKGNNPEQIYQELEKSSDRILFEVINLDEKDTSISAVKQSIMEFANATKNTISTEAKNLKENSEWKTFTIAFYGETNAGKSTIIETLRILLREKSKTEEIRKFKEFEINNNVRDEDLKKIDQELLMCKESNEKLNIEKKKTEDEFFLKKNRISFEMQELKNIIEDKKLSFSKLKKILYFLGLKKIKEESKYKSLEKEIVQQEFDKKNKLKDIDNQIKTKENEISFFYSTKEKMLKKLENLIQFADGNIIGDGRSDFTRNNHIYEFNYDNSRFNLIDVPGIEGSEKKVEDTIWEAVKKAHAVCYVTNKAARPQTGDNSKKGTLEKIKTHLGSQTEVWTLFNQSVTNPIRLKYPLVNDDEQGGINDLDDSMKELFGNKYCGSICLSALPAFLSVSECLVPGTDRYKQKNKFLEKFLKSDILEFSNINLFKSKLEDISLDFPNKIKRANFYKASCLLKNVTDGIDHLVSEKIEPSYKKFDEDVQNTNKQIDNSVEKLKKDLKNNAYKCIRNFRDKVADKTYVYIDTNVNNRDFGSRFKEYLEEEQKILIKDIENSVKKDIDKFTNDIKKIVSGLQERVNEFIALNKERYIESMDNFNLDLNIKLNIDIAGISGTLIGIAGTIWAALSVATGGVLAIVGVVLGALTALISAAKTILGMVNKSYRRAEQRKTTDKNLAEIESGVQKNIDDYIKKSITSEIKKSIEKIKVDIKLPVEQMKKMKNIITDVGNNLSELRSMTEIFEDVAVN